MSIKTVTKAIAVLLIIVASFMIFPLGIALWEKDYNSFKAFSIPILSTFIIAGITVFILRKTTREQLSTRGGFLMVSASWFFASLLGALPFYISGKITSFSDAFFETMSGFTTTGATIITDIESLPDAILFWRSLTHWLGGMGIVVLAVAIFPLLKIGGLQLIKAEAPGPTVDKITPRITETAKTLWYIYIGMSIAETVLLKLSGMTLFDAMTHTFGTLATGGFSTKNSSVGHYDNAAIDVIITIFMVLAGINFSLHYKLITGNIKSFFKDTELKAYLFIFGIATLLISFDIYEKVYSSFAQSLRFASFQAASILTTTGFATANYENWPMTAQHILFILMFVGGCSGSTGGGIKVIRIITLLKAGLNEMKQLLHPRGIFSLSIGGVTVKRNIAYAISGFFFLYIFMLMLTTLIVSTAEESDIVTSFTTALATVGNIGPGFGNVGPSDNFAFYSSGVKWFLSFAMMAGRLEIYTVLIIFTPAFWKK